MSDWSTSARNPTGDAYGGHASRAARSVAGEARPSDEARICMPTWRAFARAPFQCYRYEAQDVLASVEKVDMVPLQAKASLQKRERLLRRLMWYPTGRYAAVLNPGLGEVRLTRTYDAFVAVCENWWDLLYINAVKGWEQNCRTSILWLDELFVGMLHRYRHWLPTLNRFEHIVLGHLRSVEEAGKLLGRTCYWAPPAVDVLRFRPSEPVGTRAIHFLSVGRRYAGIHSALKRYSEQRNLFYHFDTLRGESMVVNDPREHREMYAAKVRHSQFMLVGPGMMGEPEAGGEHVIGARFFEGAAAGAVLIGVAPRCREYELLFDWPDAVIELDPEGADAEKVLDVLLADPNRMAAVSLAGMQECAKRHDWIHRWLTIYEIAGLPPSEAMLRRRQHLEEIVGQYAAMG